MHLRCQKLLSLLRNEPWLSGRPLGMSRLSSPAARRPTSPAARRQSALLEQYARTLEEAPEQTDLADFWQARPRRGIVAAANDDVDDSCRASPTEELDAILRAMEQRAEDLDTAFRDYEVLQSAANPSLPVLAYARASELLDDTLRGCGCKGGAACLRALGFLMGLLLCADAGPRAN